MSSLFNYLAQEIFSLLKGSGRILSLYNQEGNSTWEPTEATRFFSKTDGMMLIINQEGANSSVILNLSNDQNINEMMDLIEALRNTCIRHNVIFNVKKYSFTLQPKHFAFNTKKVKEAYDKRWGSTKSTYERYGSSKLIIRHQVRVNEEKKGSRSRSTNIKSIFVQNYLGERFHFPYKHLRGGRAFAQHINQGGNNWDKNARKIYDLTEKHVIVRRYLTLANKVGITEEITDFRYNLDFIFKDLSKKLHQVSQTNLYKSVLESTKIYRTKLSEEFLVNEVIKVKSMLNINEDSDLRLHTLISIIKEYSGDTNMSSSTLPVQTGNPELGGFDLVSLAKNENFNQRSLDNLRFDIKNAGLSETTSKINENMFRKLTKKMKKIKEQKSQMPLNDKSPSKVWAYHASWLSEVVSNDNLALGLNEMHDRLQENLDSKLSSREKGIIKYLSEKFNKQMWPKYLQTFKEMKDVVFPVINSESFEFHTKRIDEFFNNFSLNRIFEQEPMDPPQSDEPVDPTAAPSDASATTSDPALASAEPENTAAPVPPPPPTPTQASAVSTDPAIQDLNDKIDNLIDQITSLVQKKEPPSTNYGLPDNKDIEQASESSELNDELIIPYDTGDSFIKDVTDRDYGDNDDDDEENNESYNLSELDRLKKVAGLL